MAYTTQQAIEAKIPGPDLTDALDDNGDGQRDAGLLDQIIANASLAVDAMIGNRYEVPLVSAPAAVQNAALLFACEEVYTRRRREMPKVLADAVAAARDWLSQVRDGKQTLDQAAAIKIAGNSGGNPRVPGRVPVSGDVNY